MDSHDDAIALLVKLHEEAAELWADCERTRRLIDKSRRQLAAFSRYFSNVAIERTPGNLPLKPERARIGR
jgi:hypothetical protein